MDDLYLEHILDHFHFPRKKGELSAPTHQASLTNASCGDTLQLQLFLDESDVVQDISWQGSGCAISQATASILAERMIGQNISAFASLGLPEIRELLGVEISPARTKCAMLFVRAVQQCQKEKI